MKFTIALLLLVSYTNAAGFWGLSPLSTEEEPIQTHNKYQSSHEYMYNFESQVLTGIPAVSKQYSGIKVMCKVKLHFTSATEGILKMDDVKLYTLNGQINEPTMLPPRHQLHSDLFTQLPSEQQEKAVTKLILPVKFTWSHGKITGLEITTKETNWSLDIKRSVLALMQVKLQPESADYKHTEELSFDSLVNNGTVTFDTREESLTGICQSTLNVEKWRYKPTRFTVTKELDMDKCVLSNKVMKLIWQSRPCDCDCEMNLKGEACICEKTCKKGKKYNSVRTDYEIMSDDMEEIIVRKAVQSMESRREFPTQEEQFIALYSNQSFVLVDQTSEITLQREARQFTWKTVSEPWKMQVIRFEDEEPMMSKEERMQHVRNLVNEMETIVNRVDKEDEHVAVFHQVVETLQLLKKDELETLFKEYKTNILTSNTKWQIFLDAMTSSNHTFADEILVEKMHSGDIVTMDAYKILIDWTTDKVPTHQLLNKFKTWVVDNLSYEKDKHVYKHAMLCLGAMTQRLFYHEQMMLNKAILKEEITLHRSQLAQIRQFEKVIERNLLAAVDDEEKLICLKALSNAASLNSLPSIQKLLKTTQSKSVRFNAVFTVGRLSKLNKVKVLQTVLPIFMSVNESREIRMAAFIVMMNAEPGVGKLDMIRLRLEREIDVELKTFCVKYMKMLTENRERCYQERNRQLRIVLQKMKPFQFSDLSHVSQFVFGEESYSDIYSVSSLASQTMPYLPKTMQISHMFNSLNLTHNVISLGYHQTGLEKFAEKLMRPSAVRREERIHADFSTLGVSKPIREMEEKPHITIYMKMFGKHVAFWHFTEQTLNQYIVQGLRDGEISIPVRYFQTKMTHPQVTGTLKPMGMKVNSEHWLATTVNIDGAIKIRMSSEMLPLISFETNKPIKFMTKTLQASVVRAGFVKFGVCAASMHKINMDATQISATLDMHQKQFRMTYQTPNTDFIRRELDLYTTTFVAPTHLPVISHKNTHFKVLSTDDTDRRQFTLPVQFFKSIGLIHEVQADINLPQLYKLVRDRMHLIPTVSMLRRQHVIYTVRPISTGSRTFEFGFGYNDTISPESYLAEEELSEELEYDIKPQWSLKSLFNWESKEHHSEEEEHEFPRVRKYMQYPLTLGSARVVFYMYALSKTNSNLVQRMTVNFTTLYEHDMPTVRYHMVVDRPPIPGVETGRWQFKSVMNKTYQPSDRHVVATVLCEWGLESMTRKAHVQATIMYKPMPKNNQCIRDTLYGCQDEYGVVYPVWSNTTNMLTWKNTQIPEYLRDLMTPYLYNMAQSVLLREKMGEIIPKRKMTFDIINKQNQEMNIVFRNETQILNMTNIHAPLECKAIEYFYKSYYPIGQIRMNPVNDYIPRHVQRVPLEHRDTCIVENPRIVTFDRKELRLPETDCEVILAKDCRHKQFAITLKPLTATSANEKKVVTILVGDKKIELTYTPSSLSMPKGVQVKVNNELKPLLEDGELEIINPKTKEILCVIVWKMGRCEVRVIPTHVYMHITPHNIELKAEKKYTSERVCGMCSERPELSSPVSVSKVMEFVKENRKPGAECTVTEPTSPESNSIYKPTCRKIYKHRIHHMSSYEGQGLICVSMVPQPMCSDTCKSQTTFEDQHVRAKCVRVEKAEKYGIKPEYFVRNGLYLRDSSPLKKMHKQTIMDVKMPVAVVCNA